MAWEVQIVSAQGFTYEIYIYELVNTRGDMRILRPGADGTWTIEESPYVAGEGRTRPSLAFPVRDGQGILRSLASQLASHGFSTLDPGGVAKAKDAHIASLEEQAKRLFILAGGTRVRAGEVEIEHGRKG